MSEKYQITGPEDEKLGVFFTPEKEKVTIGGKTRFRPFLDYIVFDYLGLKLKDITKEGVKQKHKYRYTIKVSPKRFRRKLYSLRSKYTFEKINSIIKLM